jgi:hypothetical protein
MLEKIYETEDFVIWKDNKGFDFQYDIENKTSDLLTINMTDFDYQIIVKDWVGFFNNEEYIIEDIITGKYELLKEEF